MRQFFILMCVVLMGGSAVASPLQSYRAVYDLTLSGTRPSTQVESAQGRISIDFNHSACDGTVTVFRQQSQIAGFDGNKNSYDTVAKTYEDAAGRQLSYLSETTVNGQSAKVIDGRAVRQKDGLAIDLRKPQKSDVFLKEELMLPNAHLLAVIEAAQKGQNILNKRVFDGTDDGVSPLEVTAIIGKPTTRPLDEPLAKANLGTMVRWPVVLSYFTKNDRKDDRPSYTVSFDLLANGVSSSLLLDYGDFALKGQMISYEAIPTKPCS